MAIEATLGEFSCPGDQKATTGTLTVVDGRVMLNLIGCLERDRLPVGTTFAGYPREVPEDGRHAVVRGLLQSGEPVMLLGVHGRAWGSPNVYNGKSWRLGEDALSGNSVQMRADHAVMRALDEEEPEFDEITFEMRRLDSLLCRTQVWWPTGEISEVAGFAPVVVVPVDDYEFEVVGFRVGLRQVIRRSADAQLGELASTRFSISRVDATVRFSECVDVLKDLRMLAGLGCHGHVPLGEASGWLLPDGTTGPHREEFPIHTQIQAERNQRGPTTQILSVGSLYRREQTNKIGELKAKVEAADANRADLIMRWLDWVKRDGNRELMASYLSVFDGTTRPSVLAVFRSTMGVVEDLMSSPASGPRVEGVRRSKSARGELLSTRSGRRWRSFRIAVRSIGPSRDSATASRPKAWPES